MSNGQTASQTILLTVLPAGVTRSGGLRVSVLVSLRLTGATALAGYADILRWTRDLRAHPLALTFLAGGQEHTVTASTKGLRPDLWERLFTQDTPVEPYRFDDYTERLVISYPARSALSTLKSIYQIASVQLALP